MLAREGCSLAIVARRGALLETLADEIEALGWRRPLAIVCDITRRDAPQLIRHQVAGHLGHLDILINNAGGSRRSTASARSNSGKRDVLDFHAARGWRMRSSATCRRAASAAS